MEDRVAQVVAAPAQGRGQGRFVERRVDLVDVEALHRLAREDAPQGLEVRPTGGLVEGDPEMVAVDETQVDAGFPGPRRDAPRLAGSAHRDRVEVCVGQHLEPETIEPLHHDAGHAVHALRNGAQPLRPVIHGVETGDVREQHLRGADVAGGLLAANVLLAGLERHA